MKQINTTNNTTNNVPLTAEERQELEELRALKAKVEESSLPIVKINPKGTVTLTKITRFGASHWPNQWRKIAENMALILKACEAAEELEEKGELPSEGDYIIVK